MEWFKKHGDTLSIIFVICVSLLWMSGKFISLEKDVTIIKIVLIMKYIRNVLMVIYRKRRPTKAI